MVPGVVRVEPFGDQVKLLRRSSVCGIVAISGQSPDLKCSKPLAVGICNMDGSDLKGPDDKGKFVLVLHADGDKLT